MTYKTPEKHRHDVITLFSVVLNVLAGGNLDTTLSARAYYLSTYHGQYDWLRRWIDWGFYPLQGPDHCYNAYLVDFDEQYYMIRWPFLFLIVPALVVALPLVWVFGCLKKKL